MDILNAPHIARQIIRTNVTRERTSTSAHKSRRGICDLRKLINGLLTASTQCFERLRSAVVAKDDGSGNALVLQLARVLNGSDVETERSIRFALWNNEEPGQNGVQTYVARHEGISQNSWINEMQALMRSPGSRTDEHTL